MARTTLQALALLSLVTGNIAWVSQYDPGVMEGVVPRQQHYGHLPADLPPVDGFIAGSDCATLGELLWLRPEGTPTWELFMIADCPHAASVQQWMERGDGTLPIIAEVDGQTAARWQMDRGRGLRVEWTTDLCELVPCE